MSSHLDVLAATALVVVIIMALTWIVSLVLHDAGIAAIVWGVAFIAVTGTAALVGDGDDARCVLLFTLVAVWGLRLTVHIWLRNLGRPEDPRYQAMRQRAGSRFPVTSLVTVFGLQGLLIWVVALPAQLAMTPTEPIGLGTLAFVGIGLWGVGFFFETVGDAQLARFLSRPDSSDQVMDRGLWRYTRHPNYFGDFCVWWGIFAVAAETADGRCGVIGPVVMSVLLTQVSGVPLLERSIGRRRPGYVDYAARTAAFFPRPPRRAAAGADRQ
jgi:steroid 5-alpha reductase family enzyme